MDKFCAETQRGTPVIAALTDGPAIVGYFSGLIVRRAGVRILGSAFPGWPTPVMRFNLSPEVPRSEAFRALDRFTFHELRCLHMEISDYFCSSSVENIEKMGFDFDLLRLRRDKSHSVRGRAHFPNGHGCRRNIRKAEKNGLVVEET
jgi:hypothetical protein